MPQDTTMWQSGSLGARTIEQARLAPPTGHARAARSFGVVAAATRTKVAEQKIKTNTKLKTTGRLAPGTTNTLNPQPLPPGKAFKLYPGAQSPKPRF
jgi:hypothetical protein